MRNHRYIKLLFAAAMATAGFTVASPAQAQPRSDIVKLVSGETGNCLQPDNGSLEQGAAIVQEPCNGSVAQQWLVTPGPSGRSHLINRFSDLCLDALGGANNGTPIVQWTCSRISNENWTFGTNDDLLVSQVSNTGTHCIAATGNEIQLRFCDDNPSQVWFRPRG